MITPLASEGFSSPLTPSREPPRIAVAISSPSWDRGKAERVAQAARRVSAWRARHYWQNERLHPYSMGRDELWHMLCEADTPLPEGVFSPILDQGHARKLLFVCATEPQVLEASSVPELLELADKWSDKHVPREHAALALALARQIRAEASCCRARLRPTGGRRSGAENTAWPVFEASYYTMLAAALQGAAQRPEMKWEISLAEGDSLIHGWWIMSGHATLWADKESTQAGQWFADFRAKYQRRE